MALRVHALMQNPDDPDAVLYRHEIHGVAGLGKAEVSRPDVVDRPTDAGELRKPLEALFERSKIRIGLRLAELPIGIDIDVVQVVVCCS